MDEYLQQVFTNYKYAIPVAIIFTGIFMYWQKKMIKNKDTTVLDSYFILRSSLFVGLLVFTSMYYNKFQASFDENLYVGPFPH